MPLLLNILLLLVCLLATCCDQRSRSTHKAPATTSSTTATAPARIPSTSDPASLIQPLIDPAKLATLGTRGANPRVQKVAAILWQAKQDAQDPAQVADQAVELIGWGGTEKGRLTSAAMLRNVTIIERLGAVTPADIDAMRRGHAPTVRQGPYTGDIISVDHIVPRAITPELDNVIANLELLPLKVNESKNDKVGERQVSMAKAFHGAGLLSDDGLKQVIGAKR